jgi:hypothetical protein
VEFASIASNRAKTLHSRNSPHIKIPLSTL